MKITLKWLLKHWIPNENVDINNIDNVCENLATLGFEVDWWKMYAPKIAVTVLSIKEIPNSKCFLCVVKLSNYINKHFNNLNNTLTIITNNIDFQINKVYNIVPMNYELSDGTLINERKILGFKSQGMFLSNQAIDNVDSIIYDDIVIKVDLPTNRPNLQNIRSLAQELSVRYGKLKELIPNREVIVSSATAMSSESCEFTSYDSKEIQLLLQRINEDNDLPSSIAKFVKHDIGYDIILTDNKIEIIHNYKKYFCHYQYLHYLCDLLKISRDNSIKYVTSSAMDQFKIIKLSCDVFSSWTRLSISPNQIIAILQSLSMQGKVIKYNQINTVHDNFAIEVQVPQYRYDITNYMDIIEEIIRIYNVNSMIDHDYVPKKLPINLMYINNATVWQNLLVNNQFVEMKTLPLVKYKTTTIIKNPLAPQTKYLRDSLIYGLCKTANEMLTNNHKSVKIFEIGEIFPSEKNRIGILIGGTILPTPLNKKYSLNHMHLTSLLNQIGIQINSDSYKFKTTIGIGDHVAHMININLKDIDKEFTSCNMYYFESAITNCNKPKVYSHHNKIHRNYTIESKKYINWSDISSMILLPHRLVSAGFFNEKYCTTFSTHFRIDQESEYHNIIEKITNIYINKEVDNEYS